MTRKQSTSHKSKTKRFTIVSLVLSLALLFGGCSSNSEAGATWYRGTENIESINYGKTGDFYWDTDDYTVYEKKSDGSWVVAVENFGKPGSDNSDLAKEVELQKSSTHIQWRYKGDANWTNLISIDLLKGATGEEGKTPYIGEDGFWYIGDEKQEGYPAAAQEIEIQKSATAIQWKYYGETALEWKDLVTLESLRGAAGSTWLSGVLDPLSSQGKDGDFYINTVSYNVFQKSNGNWNTTNPICNIKGEDGATPVIGQNGNWWIDGEDTGYKAVASGGSGSTITIDNNGYFVIDGVTTKYSAEITHEELYEKLSTIIDYDNASSFTEIYKSESSKIICAYNNSTFSGFAGSIGKPERVPVIKFLTAARDNPITKIKVWLTEQNKTGIVISQKTLDVNIPANTEKEVIWVLDEEYVNTENKALYFAYSCDQYCNGYRAEVQISSDKTDEYVKFAYVTLRTEGTPTDISKISETSSYFYFPLSIGEYEPVFKISDKVVNQILETIDITSSIYRNGQILLPKTIYGFTNQTLQIYLRNICAYSLNDVYIDVQTSNGRQFSDRWEYTPTTAETFDITIEVYSKDWKLISSSTHNVVIKDSVTTNSVKVLVIGDSTVQSGFETGKMVELSTADETFEVELLGTMGTEKNLHEGRGGWTANHYLNIESTSSFTNPFYNKETSGFDFSYYMNQQNYEGVDVVFIQLGINDIFSATNLNVDEIVNKFVARMKTLLNNIHAYDSDIKIIINLIIPCDYDQDLFSESYNALQTVWGFMRNMYKANQKLLETFAETGNVYLSWYNSALDAENNQGGNVHPTVEGYEQLGTQMYYMLKAII